MDPFELFESSEVYKFAILYFSSSRGLAIIGRHKDKEKVEVIQISGEVDPHTGHFTALDYGSDRSKERLPVISKKDFESLVEFIESKIDDQTRMSVIEPELIRAALAQGCVEDRGKFLH